ncbi:hypothetical protein AJ87_16810 [Rhizobium yanglingense]|nr:hypothetical protein AJ87_16810 [Rhizobium yanglingense]
MEDHAKARANPLKLASVSWDKRTVPFPSQRNFFAVDRYRAVTGRLKEVNATEERRFPRSASPNY